MKFSIFFQKDRPEEVIVYAEEESEITRAIRRLCEEEPLCLMGYDKEKAVPLEASSICCFMVEEGRVFALTAKEKLAVKYRIYQLEEALGDVFVKINQSCLANVSQIDCFEVSLGGSLRVRFQNGYTEYVSRRNLKKVKERLGL
ncbi:MAG: LytTR family transcriptional regulator [Clostridia bacterium]|nr:LytTR family transcriptional regulator [Clostridia bacterium]